MKKQPLLFLLLTTSLMLVTCTSPATKERVANTASGIEILLSADSITNIFRGIFGVMQTSLNNQHIEKSFGAITLNITNIDLRSFSLNTATSKTEFLSANSFRLHIFLDDIFLDFSYKITAFSKFLPPLTSGSGTLIDRKALLVADVVIAEKSDSPQPMSFKLKNLHFSFGSLSVDMNPTK